MGRNRLFRSEGDNKPTTAVPLIEIVGDHRVLIEHHRGVQGYDKERICIKLSFGMVFVQGCNLEITYMSKAQLVITGKIQNVVFRRGSS